MDISAYKKTDVAGAVSYIVPEFNPDVLQKAQNKEDLQKHILEQTQGESVILSEIYDIPTLMYITNVIYSSSPELVFVTKEGLKIQIFDFTSEPVIRDTDIITAFSNLYKVISKNEVKSSILINIEEIWDAEKSSNQEEKLYNSLQKVVKKIAVSPKITLLGKYPSVLFLLTQHYVSTKTKELWYQENLGSKPVRIY